MRSSSRSVAPERLVLLVSGVRVFCAAYGVGRRGDTGLDEDDDGGGNGDIYTGSSPGMINPGNPTSFQLWGSLPTVGGGSLRNTSAANEAAWLGSSSIPWYQVGANGQISVLFWNAPQIQTDSNGNTSLTIGGWGWVPVPGMQFTQTSPTTWTFTSQYTFQQTVQSFKRTGLVENPQDYLDIWHQGQLDLRDMNPFCSMHLDVDKSSGQNGQPTTGDAHIDAVNPWAPSPYPSFIPGGPLLLPAGHAIFDLTHLYNGAKACQ